jgi:hypothetical protein
MRESRARVAIASPRLLKNVEIPRAAARLFSCATSRARQPQKTSLFPPWRRSWLRRRGVEQRRRRVPAGTKSALVRMGKSAKVGDWTVKVTGGLSFELVGKSAVAYDYRSYCGVVPNALPSTTEVFQGGNITGNFCWDIKSSDANSLVMFVNVGYRQADRVYFALPK